MNNYARSKLFVFNSFKWLIGLYGKLGFGGILHVFVYINKHIKPTCCTHV